MPNKSIKPDFNFLTNEKRVQERESQRQRKKERKPIDKSN